MAAPHLALVLSPSGARGAPGPGGRRLRSQGRHPLPSRVCCTQIYHPGMTSAPFDPAALAQRRLDNALALFDEFVAQTVSDPDATALRGLERRFAEKVLIQPSYWSQIKSRHRQIGERLARQFEQRCRKPVGWMDQPHDHGATPRLAEQVPVDDTPPDTSSTPEGTPMKHEYRYLCSDKPSRVPSWLRRIWLWC